MGKSVIVLVGYNSPCFPTPSSATISIDGVWYDYTGFPYPQFENLSKHNPGQMLNWLKANSESVQKLEGGA